MTTVVKKQSKERGQAAIEMALSLPFIVWLMFYTINAFFSVHTAHIAQRYAMMNVYERVDNRAQFAVDDVANNGQGALTARTYIAVQYTDMEGRPPARKILVGPLLINAVAGICREPDCR